MGTHSQPRIRQIPLPILHNHNHNNLLLLLPPTHIRHHRLLPLLHHILPLLLLHHLPLLPLPPIAIPLPLLLHPLPPINVHRHLPLIHHLLLPDTVTRPPLWDVGLLLQLGRREHGRAGRHQGGRAGRLAVPRCEPRVAGAGARTRGSCSFDEGDGIPAGADEVGEEDGAAWAWAGAGAGAWKARAAGVDVVGVYVDHYYDGRVDVPCAVYDVELSHLCIDGGHHAD
ncbi:hypothetical protein B0H34DRAFT_711180 [Crassisporium funariophilum]|nr:hypothetical protein B0H34DRAFT_711180 [Crassisporium funariophilum]